MAKTLNVIKRSPKKQPKGRFSKKESASVPELSYRDDKEQDDYYGSKAAGQSDSSEFSRGGPIEGKGHKSHLGRPGRASGGRASSGSMTEKPRRSIGPDETDHASEYGALSRTENTPPAGRANRASGGRTKGKTVVNVIVAGGRGQQQPMPAPMPMPPPGGAPPMPIQRPPMAPGAPSGMPPGVGGGMPMGAMPTNAPPYSGPGSVGPQMAAIPRKRGGRVEEKYGAASGEGRLEKTAREKRNNPELR